jgi:putative tricarboxylic transport membrane protein
LVFFGLSVAGSVGAQSALKGWLSVCIGLLIATVGTSPAGSVPRYNFDTMYLMGGIQFVPVVLGVFAVSEVLVQGQNAISGLRMPPKVGIDFPKLIEFWRLRIAILRSMLIGFFAGILPGIGATLAAFLGYSEAVRWSRTPERFGKGELEGVVSSETANNAATGAAMIPLLALGIPGGALTAMMLAAFQIHGIDPGPSLFINSTELVWIVFVSMLFANLAIFLLGYIETKTVVHLLRIPFPILAPIILLLGTIGAYAGRNLMLDVWVMYIAGILAFLLRRSGYSMAGVVLGVILGEVGENAFVKAMPMVDYDVIALLQRPICFILIFAGLASVLFSVFRWIRKPSLATHIGEAG